MERLLRATELLMGETSHVTGTKFFRHLARGVATVLDVKAAFVGELMPSGDVVRTRAVWWGDSFLDDFDYALAGTPCELVVGRSTCFFPEHVQELFPSDEMLVQMGVHAYLGIPIFGAAREPLGILVALHDAPTPEYRPGLPHELERLFAGFADRAGLELERSSALARLEVSEARYRQIVETAHEGVWLLDAEGHTTFANEQLASMLGWTASELVGRALVDLADEPHREAARRAISAEGASAKRHEVVFRCRDGSKRSTAVSTRRVLGADGRRSGTLALVADLTEVRALEARMVQSQKLESLGILAGGVAHDFNNLLVGILGNASIALAALPADAPARAALEGIELAAVRAADLTRQMLLYSGRGRFDVRRVDLNDVVAEIARLLESVISRRATLRIEPTAELPEVDADPTQLRQVVMNLVTNASDALEGRDGTITVSTSTVDVDAATLSTTYLDDQLAPGVYVCVEVKDDGVGMDAATRARIFDPFFTTKFTGRGLGLAAMIGILRGHRGAVSVESAPGEGTTFRVLLPRATSTVAAPTLPPPGPPSSGATRVSASVLFIDDETYIRSIAKQLLEAEGFSVTVAEDGTTGLALFGAGDTFDVVIVDLTMPGISGDEVFQEIRRRRPDTFVIVSSGYDAASVDVHVGDPRAAFLAKPWRADALIAEVRRAAESREERR